LGVYVYSFFFEFSGISVLNYISVVLAVVVYAFVMSKFVKANRVMDDAAVA